MVGLDAPGIDGKSQRLLDREADTTRGLAVAGDVHARPDAAIGASRQEHRNAVNGMDLGVARVGVGQYQTD